MTADTFFTPLSSHLVQIVLAVLGTLISLTLFLTLNRFNFLAAAIAVTVGALIYLASSPRRAVSA